MTDIPRQPTTGGAPAQVLGAADAHDKILDHILSEVASRLAVRYSEDQVDMALNELAAEFRDARITAFLPTLALKRAARMLAEADAAVALAKEQPASPLPEEKLDFLRFEFKYILPDEQRLQIEEEVAGFMTLDRFVADHEDRSYVVRSLYYDDPAYSSYYQKTEGALLRSKFRLRTYTRDPNEPSAIYLELKGRYNALVFKRRTGLGQGASFAECANVTEEILRGAPGCPITDQFRLALSQQKIRPTMLIEYVRRPYLSRYDRDFRLTLDHELFAAATDQLFPGDLSRRREFLTGHTVMEVKFRNTIPLWFHRIIKHHRLRRVSISKVCKGMEACRLVPNLD